MKTLTINNRIIQITAAMLLSILFCFSIQAQAATAKATAKTTAFDHTQTGFILKDVHLTLKCEQCHVDGIFKNTPTYCAGCHAVGTRVGATPQPLNHVQTTQPCDTCHISAANFQVRSFNHMSVTGNCTSCHGGQSLGVLSLSSTHIPLTAYPTLPDCSSCHTNTTTFLSYSSVNVHANISSGCSQCHGGPAGADAGSGSIGIYPGVVAYNPATHVPLTSQVNCVSCHFSFSTFLGATYTHTSLDSNKCSTCHQGQYAGVVSYVSGVHIPLPAGSNCAPCHIDPSFSPASKPTFLGSAFHTSTNGVTVAAITSGSGKCAVCHSGSYTSQNAQPVGTTHIPTTSDCSVCHTDSTGTPVNNTNSYTTFLNSKFHQSSVGISYTGLCATCHSGSYISEGAQSKTSILPTHIPINVDCGTCHTSANTGTFTSFLGAIFHQTTEGATAAQADVAGGGKCVTCHNGSFSAQLAQPVGATHIPFTADCAVCHTDTTGTPLNNTSSYTTFLNAKFHQSTAGAPPTGLCSTCHNGSYLTEGAYSTTSVITTHVTVAAGTDCVACHTIASTASYTTFLNATYAHSATYGATFPQATGQSPTCASCHNGTTAKGVVAGHVTYPASQDCNSSGCHTPSTDGCGTAGNCLNFSGVIYSHAGTYPSGFPTTTAAPTPVSCLSCHSGTTNLAQTIASYASHVPIGSYDCNYCHTYVDTGCGTTGATCSTFLGAKYNHTTTPAGTCGTCHISQYANVVSLASITHIPQTLGNACDTCHTSTSTGITSAFSSTQSQTFAGASFHSPGGVLGATPATCSNCHNGSYPAPTAYGTNATSPASLGAQAMNAVSSFTHIATTADCITCHTATNTSTFTTFLSTALTTMVHNATTTPAAGCGTCHLGQYTGVISLSSTTHIPQTSGNACDTCHTSAISSYTTTNPTFANVLFHTNALGNPPTTACSTCHSGSYTPAAAVSGANGANSGLAATGASSKSSVITTHVATSAECSTCHTVTNTGNYANFLGASGYNHTATYPTWTAATTGFPASPASPTCASCHNGSTATGINAGHPAVGTTDCNSCHTSTILQGCPSCTLFGVPAAVVHNTAAYTAATGGCVSCHNGTTAVGLASDTGHIPIGSVSCAQCHPVYDGAGSINFSTAAAPTVTGTTGAGLVAKYVMNHTGLPTTCGVTCHNGSYTSQGINGASYKSSISNHIPTTLAGTNECTWCHITEATAAGMTTGFASGTNLTSWSAYTMSTTQHAADQGGSPNYCVTCHLSSATYLQTGIQKVSHNGASTSKDCSSSSCHKPLGSKGTSYTSWN